jgi:peptidoglycan hydrolase CwlO-like protein
MAVYGSLSMGLNKTKMKKRKQRLLPLVNRLRSRTVLAAAVLLISGGSFVAIVRADSYQQQIDSLNAQNAQAQGSKNALQLQATSYQDAVNVLQQQIYGIQSAIAANQTKQSEIQQQILVDQAQLAQDKQVLGDDIEAMYVNGQMTTVEMLATSKSLSDFVDAETYRNAVQDKIQSEFTEITNLENQLEGQQVQIQQFIKTEQAQQSQLNNEESQQAQLLAMNQSQQATYNQQIQNNQSQISNLEAEQAAINAEYATAIHVSPSPDVAAASGTCNPPSIDEGNGGYPAAWCDASLDSILDSSGIQNRECTSFAYWYFTEVENNSLSVSGNAGQWWYTANLPVDQTPQVGAIGVEPEDAAPHYSPFGHVMIVLALPGTTYDGSLPYSVNAAGTAVPAGDVLVMSMNEDEHGNFMYDLWPASTLYYIHQ